MTATSSSLSGHQIQYSTAENDGAWQQCRKRSRRVVNRLPRPRLSALTFVARSAGLVLLFSLFLIASGAHDTDAAEWPQRARYWFLMTGLSAAVLSTGNFLASKGWVETDYWKRNGSVAGILMLPLTGLAMMLCTSLFGGSPSVDRFSLLLPPMISVVGVLQIMLSSRWVAAETKDVLLQAEPQESGAHLLRQLPLPLCDGDLLAIEAQDHYVRVYTSSGNAMLRMRLRDAIDLTQNCGFRVHRSWWVKRDAVVGVRRRRKGAVITLINGVEVPASRKGSDQLRGES